MVIKCHSFFPRTFLATRMHSSKMPNARFNGHLYGGCLSRGRPPRGVYTNPDLAGIHTSLPIAYWNTNTLGYKPAHYMLGYTHPAHGMLGYTHPCPLHTGIQTHPCPLHAGTHTPCPLHAGIHTYTPAHCMLEYTPL